MKKKIYAILSMFLIAITCVLASACGDKYKKMEFQVLYAYSADAKNWHDGTNGIFIAYGEEQIVSEGEEPSSLVFDENGQASLFVKVKIKNVKSKHLGAISMSFASGNGLEFSQKIVSRNKAIEIPISKDVKINTTLKLHENNSGKDFSTSFKIAKRLEALGADLTINPAMFSTSTLKLENLTNDVIIYNPDKSETNETGVKYSIGGIGYCTVTGFTSTHDAEQALNFVELTDGVLKIKDDSFIGTSNAIKIVATSIYHDGVINPEDLISTEFYVYVVKTLTKQDSQEILVPTVKFESNDVLVDKINIYENGGDYSTSTIKVDVENDVNLIPVNTYTGEGIKSASIKECLYVKSSTGAFTKYNFAGENQQEGINGLSVVNKVIDSSLSSDHSYKFSIFDRNVQQNVVKIAYEFDVLNFTYSDNCPVYEKQIVVNKLAVPRYITLNDVIDLGNGAAATGYIYITSSQSYQGLIVKVNANPTTNASHTIEINKSDKVIVSDLQGNNVTSIVSGASIVIRLKDNATNNESVTFKTLCSPSDDYNGQTVDSKQYITATYNIKKVVTANDLTFVDSNGAELTSNAYIKAQGGGFVYVKASYSGANMDAGTIKLTSNNDSILFANGTKETTLASTGSSIVMSDVDYLIYKVEIKSPNSVCVADIEAVAAEGKIGVSAQAKVEAVHTAAADARVEVSSDDVVSVREDGLSNCFILANADFAEFKTNLFHNALSQTNAIKKVDITKEDAGNSCVNINPISTIFTAVGQGYGRNIFNVKVHYYTVDNNGNVIETYAETLIQIAVFNPITNINVVADRLNIAYVSSYYENVGTANITFKASTFVGESLSHKVKFLNNANDEVEVDAITGVKVSCLTDVSLCKDYISGLDKIKSYTGENISSGVTIPVKLTNDITSHVDKLQFKFTALTYGKETSISKNITITVNKVNKAEGIQITGNKDVAVDKAGMIDDAEIHMSFIDIPDEGYDEVEFDVKILFDETKTGIKLNNPDEDLTYLLYNYRYDDNNQYIKEWDNDVNAYVYVKDLISKDSFNIEILNGKVNIKAFKENKGGAFQLVLATKDSYIGEPNKDEDTIGYKDFAKTRTITIKVHDGEEEAFAIYNESDLKAINNNLDKRFALYDNVVVETDLNPLGYVNGALTQFTGELKGHPDGVDGPYYSITQTLNSAVASTSYGDVAGLFGLIGQGGIVKELTYVLKFKYISEGLNFDSNSRDGLRIGGISAVNLGTIENVKVVTINAQTLKSKSNGDMYIGGIAGVNKGIIKNSSVANESLMTVKTTAPNTKVGLIAGRNEKLISGKYVSKESLNEYVFDVAANLDVEPSGNADISAVAGENVGQITNMLIGGKVVTTGGNLGGFAGVSTALTGATEETCVETCVALSLDLFNKNINSVVGGIIAHAKNTKIDYVKFVSAKTEFSYKQENGQFINYQTHGIIKGQSGNYCGIVGGIIGIADTNVEIIESSVESFINDYIIYGGTVGGLVASGSANVSNSFVKANMYAVNSGYYTSNGELTNVYFIGTANKVLTQHEEEYCYEPSAFDLSAYMEKKNYNNIENWEYIYRTQDTSISKNTQFTKATQTETLEGDWYYYELKVTEWANYITTHLISGWTKDAQDNSLKNYNSIWEIQSSYNVVNVNGVDLFLPYILKSGSSDPLMIVEPKYIFADINENYVTKKDSDMINDYADPVKNIAESVVVNFFKGAGEEFNTYKLISDNDDDNGLFDITLLPANAQGRYGYKIVEGEQYAYINSNRELVILQESGVERIVIEIYSIFNLDCKTYVAVYSQSLLTELKLNSNKLEKIDAGKYETSLFVGQENLIVALDAVNMSGIGGKIDYTSILDVIDPEKGFHDGNQWNIFVDITSDKGADSVLKFDSEINVEDFASISFGIKNTEEDLIKIVQDYHETITIALCLRKEYFANSYVKDDVPLGSVELVVYPYNSAEAVLVNGDDLEMFSKDEMLFEVLLKTQAIPTGDKNLSKEKVNIENLKDNDGLIILDEQGAQRDSIKIELEPNVNSEAEINKIKSEINKLIEDEDKYVEYLTELFDIVIHRELYKAQDEITILGYKYNVAIALKDEHVYRNINSDIRFNIKVAATSNSAVNNGDGLEVTIKPTQLTTVRMDSYAVNEIKYNTDYSEKIIDNSDVNTSIIQPGKTGNLMMIYLEPSYSQVNSIKIKSSKINVPKLGETKINFSQLIYDEKIKKYTTLYGADVPIQEDNVLEINKLTYKDSQGINVYTGVIYVLMQLPKFVGLETTITVSLEVETSENVVIEQSKDLLTTYLPDASVAFDDEKMIKDDPDLKNAYYVQKGTSDNELKITVIGYQFESNPRIKISWDPSACGSYVSRDDGYQTFKSGSEIKYVGDYVTWFLDNNFQDAIYDPSNDSYTLTLHIGVSEKLIAPVKISVEMELITKDGQRVSSAENPEDAEDDYVILWPTDYIVTSYGVDALSNGRKNVAINSSSALKLFFDTENKNVDYSDAIFNQLITAYENNKAKLANLFKFYKEEKGEVVNLADSSIEELTFDVVTRNINGQVEYVLQVFGIAQFKKTITLTIPYYYVKSADGLSYELSFTLPVVDEEDEEDEDRIKYDDYGSPLETTFELNIFAVNSENEIPIYTAEEIYDSKSGQWNLVEGVYYVLMNDIELENVVPITTKIAQLDGNNRTISIKSFKIDDNATEYGLFANIGTYKVMNPITEKEEDKQTILKNVIVDYSKLSGGSIPLGNSVAETLSIGGLVGSNDGGLIYNCDVVNLSIETKAIDVIVPLSAHVKFGGLVGDNKGIITNSRVGRDSYERVSILNSVVSQRTINLGGLKFIISHNVQDETGNNFKNDFAGFAGVNTGTISNSYVTRTNLINYSTNEQLNNTAGFVATNSGTILSSFVKADEQSITTDKPQSTGYVVDQKGNGIVAGFVYENNGTISNSYSNIELQTKSAYISGFVYENNGAISESYAASTMNSGSGDNNAEQPFVGVDNAGTLMSFGTIKNAYYLMRTENDTPYVEGSKPVANALNVSNFQIAENLTNFAFVLGNSVTERKQGIWSYYTLENKKRVLPEIMSANTIAFSFRSEQSRTNVETGEKETIFVAPAICENGTQNNPFTISSVEEYNEYFTLDGQIESRSGYFRLINNISFLADIDGESQAISISTKTNYVLGSDGTITSFEGNGLTIRNIYLDVEVEEGRTINSIGLFGEIKNAYIKNVNLEFATPTENGQFSTTSAIYSGGLAGKISNSAIMNINITGNNTTLVGSNFVGGLAGLIEGKSLIYGVESSLNIKSENPGQRLYYNEKDYIALNRVASTGAYDSYLKTLSYAGGIAGVLDFEQKQGVDFNVHSVTVRGDMMSEKLDKNGKKEPNITGQYVGGVAGYASSSTNALRLNYVMGENELIYGEYAVGGIYGVSLGRLVASQVSAKEEVQYEYDTKMGEYFIQIARNKKILAENQTATVVEATLDEEAIGNTQLLESANNVGGLIGIGLGATIHSNYSKATVKDGVIVGGLVGLNVASDATYSYAVLYVNASEKLSKVGGLFGLMCPVKISGSARHVNLREYSRLIDHETSKTNNTIPSVQFTYSTVLLDETFEAPNAQIDYVAADYQDEDGNYIATEASEGLKYVYAGLYNDEISNNTKETNNAVVCEAFELYNLGEAIQELTFNDVFSSWSSIKYWSLNNSKYLPLLTTKAVDNFIEIDDASDLVLIEKNPTANYKIVKDIPIYAPKDANWIIDCKDEGFSGILLGEKESDTSRPKITIYGLNPTISKTTAGFINKCKGAQISNIEIVWKNQSDGVESASINMKNLSDKTLTYVSGLVCEDENSLIDNVLVRAETYTEKPGTIIGTIIETDEDEPAENEIIQGFGGIVGFGVDTKITSCDFAGQVTATLTTVTSGLMVGGGDTGSAEVGVGFGGVAGVLVSSHLGGDDDNNGNNEQNGAGNNSPGENEEDKEDESADKVEKITTAMISGNKIGASKSSVGNAKYPQTRFNITVKNTSANVGGVVGKTYNVAIANTSIGGLDYDDNYKRIKLNVKLDDARNINIGGVGGKIEEGVINAITDLIDIKLSGKGDTTARWSVNVGGFAGEYALSALKSLTTGVRKSSVNANIEVENLELLNSQLSISTGFGGLASNAHVEQCLFDGSVEMHDESNTNILTVYAGSIAGLVSGNARVQEVIANSQLYAGSKDTTKLYAGGFIGCVEGGVTIESSTTWGRVIPKTSSNASIICAGGFIGKADNIIANNSYSLSSIVMSQLADSAINALTVGALVGEIGDEEDTPDVANIQSATGNIEFNNVYYSSDIALCVDENYDANNQPIGINIAGANMLVTVSPWAKNLTSLPGGMWGKFESSKIPHVASLEDSLKNFGIVKNNEYLIGSVMNPYKIIDATSYEFKDNYNYYVIANLETLPRFTKPLSGILIGSDVGVEVASNSYGYGISAGSGAFSISNDGSSKGIISCVNSDSAVSNLHIKLGHNVTYNFDSTTNNGFIAGMNEGVIFNCSVQGDLININATNGVGLIAGNNKGMISHSYSSAEISKAEDGAGGAAAAGAMPQLAGITFTNSGKLLSNYFTGYLNSSIVGAAGIFVAVDGADSGYAYNNYMGGVVTKAVGNAFAGTDFAGSNNYIDRYSDVSLWGQDEGVLISITTAQLMGNKDSEGEELLKGKWITVLNNQGEFDEKVIANNGEQVDNPYFGRNYNYPIYRFNKMAVKSETEYYCIDDQKQLKTGNGLSTMTDLVDRYEALVTPGIESNEYENAFKILHYGILQSIHALLGESRNYVLMYDVDATTKIDDEETGTAWTAIGSNVTNIDGFFNTSNAGFNGVFVTNRHFAQTTTNATCEISGLSGQGLFDRIDNAFIGNIILGSFTNLNGSGALGVTVQGSLANMASVQSEGEDDEIPDAPSRVNAYVTAIKFKKGSVISSVNFENAQGGMVTPEGAGNNNLYYGALFGCLDGAYVNISDFASSSNDGSANVVIKGGEQDTVGLIAGIANQAYITFEPIEEIANSDDNKLLALFKGNGTAGGLIGVMSGGYMNVGQNIVHITKFDDLAEGVAPANEAEIYYTNVLGGIVGETRGNVKINNSYVKFYSSKKNNNNEYEEVEVYANSFGGFIGYVASGNVSLLGDSTLNIQGKAINFNVSAEARSIYCGLIVGCSTGNIRVNKFILAPKEEGNAQPANAVATKDTFVVRVKKQKNNNVGIISNEGGTNNIGIGSFAGCQKGNLTIVTYTTKHIIQLESEGVENLGGLVGFYNEGKVSVDLQTSREFIGETEPFFILIGTENVGGIAGYVKGRMDVENFTSSGTLPEVNPNPVAIVANNAGAGVANDSLMMSDKGFATILLRGSQRTFDDPINFKNFGGLFGLWEDGVYLGDASSLMVNNNILVVGSGFGTYSYLGGNSFKYEPAMDDDNGQYINYKPSVMNVGGIAGALINSEVSFAHNNGQVLSSNSEEHMVSTFTGNNSLSECRLLNVGGIAGYALNTKIADSITTNEIYGYQNVGGIAGYCEGVQEDEAIYNNTVEAEKVKGAINVGGAVGYAKESKLSKNKVATHVLGNASVGGLIGLSRDTNISENIVGKSEEQNVAKIADGEPENEAESKAATVTGIIYTFVGSNTTKLSFVPTSVGGLVGTIRSTESAPSIAGNKVVETAITSNVEGSIEETVISVIKNKMVNIDVIKSDDLSTELSDSTYVYARPNNAGGYKYDEIEFNETYSGFGGFIGTIGSLDATAISSDNIISNIDINATLGTNVGTVYGVYNQIATGQVIGYPAIEHENMVDGAYFVGGLIGYHRNQSSTETPLDFNAYDEFDDQTRVIVQSRNIGMYVGGLIGKTDSQIIGSSVNQPGITSGSNSSAQQPIELTSTGNYYVGGLIGQAVLATPDTENYIYLEFCDDGLIKPSEKEDSGEHNAFTFGAFMGMLKIGPKSNGTSVDVDGYHDQDFTINAIENCNYVDGQSAFRPTRDPASSNAVYLHAQAYYINQDLLNIVGSAQTPIKNPVNNRCEGWANDYTTVRTIQRCIPAEKNNGADWDSVGVVYDAKCITRVEVSSGEITATEYEEEPGQVKRYTEDGILTPLYDDDGKLVTAWKDVYNAVESLGYSTTNPLQRGFPGYKGKLMLELLKYYSTYQGLPLATNNYNELEAACTELQSILDALPNIETEDQFDIYFNKSFFTTINGAIYFEAMVYEHPSDSGSIFDVAGKAPDEIIYASITSEEPLEWWQWALIIVGAVIMIAAAVISIFFTGGGALPAWVIVVAKIVLIAGAAGALIALGIELANATAARSTMFFLSTPNQSAGFLSSSYARKITLSGGRVVNTTDAFETDGDNGYQPISYERISDYQSGYYYKITAYEPIAYDGSTAYRVDNATQTTISIEEYENLKKDNSISIEDKIWIYDAGKTTYQNCSYENYTKDGVTYVIMQRYMYSEGQYWVNCKEATSNYAQYQTAFDPTKLDTNGAPVIDEEGEYVKISSSFYMTDASGNYIYGKFENGKYAFVGATHDNYITSMNSDGTSATLSIPTVGGDTKTLTGVTIQNPTATKDVTFRYMEGGASGEAEGYDYMTTVYYGPNGVAIPNINPDDPQVMYAIYGSATNDAPQGKLGYDCIQESETVNGQLKVKYRYLTGFTDEEPEGDKDHDYKIIKPESFVNPYQTTSYTGSNADEQGWKAAKEGETSSDGSITFKVTYFKHVGGFYIEDPDNGNTKPAVYLALDSDIDDAVTIKVIDSAGNEQKLKLNTLNASNIGNYTIKGSNGVSLSTLYYYANGKLYQKYSHILFNLNSSDGQEYGQLLEGVAYYAGEDEQYCYGKYVSNAKHQLYTRYKYSSTDFNGIWIKEEISITHEGGTKENKTIFYQLYPDESGSPQNGSPNGIKTYLCEVVKVSLSGFSDGNGGYAVYKQLESNGGTTPAGKFKVLPPRTKRS